MNERHRRAIIVAIVLLVAAIACLFGMQIMLDSADQNAGALEEQLVTAQAEIASLKAEQAAAAESAALAGQLAAEKAQLETQLTAAQTEVASLKAEQAVLAENAGLAEQLAAEKTQMETQLTAAQTEVASLKAEQAVLAENAGLAEQLAAEKAQLETQLTAANAQIAALKVQPTATPVPEMPEAEAGVPDAAQAIAELTADVAALTADVAALTAERDSLLADNAELQTQNAALQAQLALGQAKDQEEVPTMLTLRDGAVELGLVNPAQPGQTLRVRMYAGTEVLGEALATQPGEEITSLMLNGASAGEAQLEYEVLNPQGDVVYRVRIPVQLAEE